MSKSVITAARQPSTDHQNHMNSVYRSISNTRGQPQDINHHSISSLPKIKNYNPHYIKGVTMPGMSGHRLGENMGIHKLDSTTTSLQSAAGMTFQSQYRNVRTYSNLYPNPSKGFSLPSINMKNTSIFYEKQRLGVGSGLNIGHQTSNSPVQSDPRANYLSNYGNVHETIFEAPSSSERNRIQEKNLSMQVLKSPQKQIKTYEQKLANMQKDVSDKNSSMQFIHNSKTKTVIQKHKEDPASQTTENLDYALSKAKTVAKSGYFHGNDNIVLVFRSMEILMNQSGSSDASGRQKKFSPIYIPVDVVNKLYKFNTKELLKLLFDHVTFSKNSNVRLDLNKFRGYLDDYQKSHPHAVDFNTPESGVIKTSYMFQDQDYEVTIKYPYLEYHNSYKNAIIIRPLIIEEDYNLFFKTLILLSTDWPAYALKCFTNYSQFNMFSGGKMTQLGVDQHHSPSRTFKLTDKSLLKSPSEEEKNTTYIIN